jgi:hypothetical protein
MMIDTRITISSPPDRRNLVAEIFFDNEQWAELSKEGENLQLDIYPKQDGQPWSLSFQKVFEVLIEAKERLVDSRNLGEREN